MENMAPGNSRVFSAKGPSFSGDGVLSFPTMIDGWGPSDGMGFHKLLGCLEGTGVAEVMKGLYGGVEMPWFSRVWERLDELKGTLGFS